MTDTVSRIIADKIGQQTGKSVVVENRAGAGGQIGLQSMLRQPKDGYMVGLVVPATMVTLPLTNKNYKIDPKTELEPITVAVDTYLTMVVNSKLPVDTLKDFMAYAKKNENTISYGTPGVGTSFHFNNVVLAEKLGIDPLHVPYNGEISILNDIAGGRVTYALVSNQARNFIESNEVKPLAITAENRVQVMPEIATFKELGVDFKTDGWVGYAVSKGTPSEVVEKLNEIFVRAIKDPEVEQKMTAMGYSTVANSTADFSNLLDASRERYINMIESGRIKLD
ncbi:MAG: tripartite tricarboxylate transporter substrate binding protein [Alcaligenaceae bacterium]|nr:tripartite tricarboxylate transporter substrate binding protein [Alcaligenaceae bacterium]